MNVIPLSGLEINCIAKLKALGCNKALAQRLEAMGVTAGDEITPLYRSPFGTPTAYLVKDSVIALRRPDAAEITVIPEQIKHG